MKNVSKILIIFGLILYLIAGFLIWERNNPNRLAFKNYSGNYKSTAVSNPPTRIGIKDLRVDLPIYPAKVFNGQWETTTEGASYLISSPVPGEKGNSIIYAHDWESLFGPLKRITKDTIIEIEFADKKIKSFVVKQVKIVPSDQTSILAQTKDKRITLYTCTGFLDSQRLVATAILK